MIQLTRTACTADADGDGRAGIAHTPGVTSTSPPFHLLLLLLPTLLSLAVNYKTKLCLCIFQALNEFTNSARVDDSSLRSDTESQHR